MLSRVHRAGFELRVIASQTETGGPLPCSNGAEESFGLWRIEQVIHDKEPVECPGDFGSSDDALPSHICTAQTGVGITLLLVVLP